jgi:plastocyanin
MLRQVWLVTVAVVTAGMLACSGPSAAATKPGSAGAQEITVKGTDQLRYTPANITARANVPIKLTLDDLGDALIHDFVIDNAGGKRVQIEAQANTIASGEFTVPPGTYQFYCSQPGHREGGMIGTLTAS